MRNVQVDANGDLHCWNCGARAFTHKRTFRAKAIGITAAVTTVSIAALAPLGTKKKLKCQSCGKYNDVGTADPYRKDRVERDSVLEIPQPQVVPARSADELESHITTLVEDLARLELKGPDWSATVSERALTIKRPDESSTSLGEFFPDALVLDFDELIGSIFEPATARGPGTLTLLTTWAPEPPTNAKALRSDPCTLLFEEEQQALLEQLDELVILVAEWNLLGEPGNDLASTPDRSPKPASSDQSPVERLEVLVEMHRRGLISDEQFDSKQQAILDEI